MTTRCPSDLALEEHLVAPKASALGAHLSDCPQCQARLAEMQRQGDEFNRQVFPRTVDAVVAAVPKPWAFRWQWGLSLVPVAAAAALVLAVMPKSPDEGYIGTKGGALVLTVYTASTDGIRALAEQEPVPARAKLRFKVRTEVPCLLELASVDARGQVSDLYLGTRALALAAGETTLPGGVELDGSMGPERFVAICRAESTSTFDLHDALSAHVESHPDLAARWHALTNLPGNSWQTSLAVEKQP